MTKVQTSVPRSAAARAARAITLLAAVLATVSLLACGGAARSGGGVRDLSRLHRTDATGASSVVDFTRIITSGAGRVEEVLQGRVPGLQVTRLGNGDYSLRIRGGSGFLTSEPLLVLDGQIISPPLVSNALAGISPHDVARVEVLKDAGSLAFYGSRGANGVLIVTTRRGLD